MEGVGYIIPTSVLQHFLEDYEKNGGNAGFPSVPFDFEKMESFALQRYCKMGAG